MPTPNPRMIILARESRGLSQSNLAKELRISQAQLSKIENAQSEPSLELLTKMSGFLGYPLTFFSSELDQRNLPLPFYRKRRLPLSLTRKIVANLNISRKHIKTLILSVDIPENRVPRVSPESYKHSSIAALARELRILWHVPPGPIENVTRLLEKHGVLVMKTDFGTPMVDAVSMFEVDESLPPIIFTNYDVPGDRLRFTLAHELGHILLHYHLSMPPQECEKQAHDFASEFLLPAKEIRPYLSSLSLQKLVSLKQYWKVSMQSLVMRAASLKKITERQKTYWFSRMGTLGYRKIEPVDIPREEPALFREILDIHLRDFGYSESELSASLDMMLGEFQTKYAPSRSGLSLVLGQ